jgi:hypothetical protein
MRPLKKRMPHAICLRDTFRTTELYTHAVHRVLNKNIVLLKLVFDR